MLYSRDPLGNIGRSERFGSYISIMFRYVISDSRVYVFGSNIMQTHVPEGQPRGHPVCRCPSWLVGKELEISVPFNQVLGLEFFHKLNRIVVCDNPRCSRKKRTGESREKNAEESVTEQRSRQQRRPVVHAVKHHSASCTNTNVSVQSAEKCRETPQYFAYRHRDLYGPQRSVHWRGTK